MPQARLTIPVTVRRVLNAPLLERSALWPSRHCDHAERKEMP